MEHGHGPLGLERTELVFKLPRLVPRLIDEALDRRLAECAELGAFGEDAIKVFVDEALNEARKLENQLRSLRTERSFAVLHYSPIAATVEGEPLEIFPFLGSSRLANAIDRFENVSAVVHGHAHRGAFRGETPGGVPVYNVAQMVVQAEEGRPYALIEV